MTSEREQIVKFLRRRAQIHDGAAIRSREKDDRDRASTHVGISHTYGTAADAIERGLHLPEAFRDHPPDVPQNQGVL